MTFALSPLATARSHSALPSCIFQAPANPALPFLVEALRHADCAQYVDQLVVTARNHPAAQPAYLHALAAGSLPFHTVALCDFALHEFRFAASDAPGLRFLLARVERPVHRQVLLRHLAQLAGHYRRGDLSRLRSLHPGLVRSPELSQAVLGQRFREVLGSQATWIPLDGTDRVGWQDRHLHLLQAGSLAEALGAYGLGTVMLDSIHLPFLLEGCARVALAPDACLLLHLHRALAEVRQVAYRQMAIDLATTAQGRFDLARGMHSALLLHQSFWEWLHERAMGRDALLG
jgi:hypothetical protein